MPSGFLGRGIGPTAIARRAAAGNGLALWLKADAITGLSDGAAVSSWLDNSDKNRNANETVEAYKPIYKTGIINGLPIVRFDGSDDQLITADLPAPLNSLSVFFVADLVRAPSFSNHIDGVAAQNEGFNTAGWGIYLTNYFASTTQSYVQMQYNVAPSSAIGVKMNVNGVETNQLGGWPAGFAIGSVVVPTLVGSSKGFVLGYFPGGSVNRGRVDIAEILVYDSALSSQERLSVERYLGVKYALATA